MNKESTRMAENLGHFILKVKIKKGKLNYTLEINQKSGEFFNEFSLNPSKIKGKSLSYIFPEGINKWMNLSENLLKNKSINESFFYPGNEKTYLINAVPTGLKEAILSFTDISSLNYRVNVDKKKEVPSLKEDKNEENSLFCETSLINSLPDITFLLDNKLTIQLFSNNSIIKEEFSITINKGDSINKIISENISAKIKNGFKNLHTKHDIFTFKAKNSFKNNNWYEIRVKRHNSERFIILLRNVNKLVEAEEQLIEAKNLAEQHDRLKTTFLANMSHEVRTPLNGIIGFSDLVVKRHYRDDQELYRYLDLIKSSSGQLTRVINDIIDISKIESGEFSLIKKRNSIKSIINDSVKICIAESNLLKKDSTNIIIQNEEDEDIFVNTDAERIKQVLINLIKNSLKFTDRNNGYVKVGYKKDEDKIIVYVSDKGIGIPEEKQDVIFDHFRQADNSIVRKYGGTGLGLSISKNIIEMLGGKIWLKSKPNVGSTFFFSLKHEDILNPDNKQNNKTVISTENIKKNLRKKVLIIDDVEQTYLLVNSLLKNKADILYAQNGREGMDLVMENTDIDVILLDLVMPEINGYETAAMIREVNKKVRIIAHTAELINIREHNIYNAGFDEILYKPASTDQLETVVFS